MPSGAGKETMSFTNNYFYVKDVKKIQGHAINGEFFNSIKIFQTERVCYARGYYQRISEWITVGCGYVVDW